MVNNERRMDVKRRRDSAASGASTSESCRYLLVKRNAILLVLVVFSYMEVRRGGRRLLHTWVDQDDGSWMRQTSSLSPSL